MNLLAKCFSLGEKTQTSIALACNVTHQAVRKWERAGRLPQSEHTGSTDYAAKIAAIPEIAAAGITKEQLLAWSLRGWNKAKTKSRPQRIAA